MRHTMKRLDEPLTIHDNQPYAFSHGETSKSLYVIVRMPDGITIPTVIFRVISDNAWREFEFYNDAIDYYNSLP